MVWDAHKEMLECRMPIGQRLPGLSPCRMVLEGPLFAQYFEKVQATNFEVASDAFQTFKDLLTRHKSLVGAYLNSHYDEVSLREPQAL